MIFVEIKAFRSKYDNKDPFEGMTVQMASQIENAFLNTNNFKDNDITVGYSIQEANDRYDSIILVTITSVDENQSLDLDTKLCKLRDHIYKTFQNMEFRRNKNRIFIKIIT